jgi:chaperone modulatory protein CbpM
VLLAWIEEGVIAPHKDEAGYLFDRIDQARVALVCDLYYRMGVETTSLPIILSLIDQLHDARHCLRALTHAVAQQPDAVQHDITRHVAGGHKGSGGGRQ